MIVNTPSRFLNTSLFQSLMTLYPCASSRAVRVASGSASAACPLPSTSTISRLLRQQKLHDRVADQIPAAKLRTRQAFAPKLLPKQALSLGLFAAQPAYVVAQLFG
jgi:hypothetical protein